MDVRGGTWVWMLLSLAGCGGAPEEDVRLIDPPVSVPTPTDDLPIAGEPSVQLGYYVDQEYDPISDGDPCVVVHGIQGGTWTMPSVRTTGLRRQATIACSIVTERGEKVSEVTTRALFVLTHERLLEVANFPIPVHHPHPRAGYPIDDLYGLSADLSCTVSDAEGGVAHFQSLVVLSRG